MPPDYKSDLSAEEKLLISLCRISFDEKQKLMIRDLSGQVREWDYFTDLAARNGVIVLAGRNIIGCNAGDLVPGSFLDTTRAAYHKNLARITFLFNELSEILTLAEEEKIKIVLLKGAALEKTIYGNKGLRPMTDLDLLVKQSDAIKFRNKLLQSGFESSPLISPLFEKRIFPYGKHLPEMYRNGIAVEIHFWLFDDERNELTEDLLNNSSLIANKPDIYIPDPQSFFLYLVKHLDEHEKEGTFQLRIYADLAVVLAKYQDEVVNNRILDKARKAGLVQALFEKLWMLNYCWGFIYPDWVNIYLAGLKPEVIEQKFIRFLRNAGYDQPHPKEEELFRPLRKISGIRDKIMFLAGYIFPSLSYMKDKYHCKTKYGALRLYPVRWGGLLNRLIKGMSKVKSVQ